MDFAGYLQTSAKDIETEIEKFFQSWNDCVSQVSPKLLDLSKLFAEYCEGGKRIRGTLVKLGFELTGTSFTPEILKPAAAFEIFNTAILSHDDVIDLSPIRRGRPSLYRRLGGDHYGISQTICLGDMGFFLGEKIIQESNFPDSLKNKAVASFIQTMLDTVMGEMLDVELPHLDGEKVEGDILTISKLKTARYTIVGPLHLGAILGGADDKLLGQLEEFGENLGIAFQIQDDILGVFGDEKALGKSVTSDIEEGKLTLLYAYAKKKADDKQRMALNESYGRGKVDEQAAEKIRGIFISTGALDYAQKEAERLVGEAKKTIEKIEVPEDKKGLLRGLADFIVKRSH